MDNKITYYDYVKNFCNGAISIDVCDKEICMLVNFDFTIRDAEDSKGRTLENFSKAMEIIAKNVYVEDASNKKIMVLNFYKFCEKNYNKLLPIFDEHFYDFDSETVNKYGKDEIIASMVQMLEHIIGGNIPESFYEDFVKAFEEVEEDEELNEELNEIEIAYQNRKNKLIEAVENDNLYDFISDYHQQYTEEELTTVIKEYDYMMHQLMRRAKSSYLDNKDLEEAKKELIEDLKERL